MRTRDVDFITEEQEMRSNDRAHLVFLIWFFFACIIILRALYIQTFKHAYYVDQANKQYVSLTPVNFDRGTIFFSQYKKESVPVAQLRTTYRIAVDPTQIADAEILYTKLSQYITLDKDTFIQKATKQNDPYEEIAKDISLDTVSLFKSQKLVGVSFVKDNKRAYP